MKDNKSQSKIEIVNRMINICVQHELESYKKRLIKKVKNSRCQECSGKDSGIIKESECDYNRALYKFLQIIEKLK